MKWPIFVCLVVCLARFCDGLAIKCPPGVTDLSCIEERKEIEINESLKSESREVQCLAGSEWQSNCHYCRCSDEGIAECLKHATCDKEIFAEPVLCKPNTTFQRDCNTCICLENGLGLCTLGFCRRSDSFGVAPEILLTSVSELENKDEPSPKSSKTDVVVPSQNHYDVENLLNLDHDLIIIKRSTICKPLQEFMRDCNPCKCASDGLSYSCTHNECLETEIDRDKEVEVFMQSEGQDHIERHSVCQASHTFYIGCNTCHCNALGTDYSCTNKPCPLPADVELFHELKTTKSSKNKTKSQVCEAKRMFIKDCNTCWCNDDGTGYFCTRRVCVPLLPDDQADIGGIPAENLRVTKKECRPNEVFELDCNMCRCNPDGKSYACTRRACEEQNEDKKNITLSRKVRAFTTEPAKACQPGQEFRMDCNKCLCNDEGHDFSCTRIDCAALNNNHATEFNGARSKRDTYEHLTMQCSPGSVFNHDCNVCRCTKTGQHAICSIKRCNENKVDPEHAPELDMGFRCTPGEQFRRDCNDCTCSADGRSIFCTLRFCDQDVTSDI